MDIEINIEEKKAEQGVLFVVSTSIGNDDDITVRALKVMRASDIIVCEEGKVGGRFLHKYNISQKMHLLNENNEAEKTTELVEMLKIGTKISLVSDCGTPVLADPGLELIRQCIANNIKIVVVPGPTSIMTGLVASGFPINSFIYAGFLNRDKTERIKQISVIAAEPRTIVLLETPYRLMPLLEAFLQIIPNRRAYIGCNLTMPYETHHYGTFSELYEKFADLRFKGEFVVVFEGNPNTNDILTPEASSIESKYGDYERFDRSSRPSWSRDGDSRDRRPREFGDRKPRSYGDKPYGDRKPRSYGDKPYSDRKPREFGDKPYGDRKPREFGDKPYSDRKPREFGDKPYGDRKPREFGDKPYSDRKPREFGDKPYSDRKPRSYGDKPYSDRKPREFGDKPYGDRKPRSYGDKPYSDRKPREFGDKPYGDRKPREFGDKPYSDRKPREFGDKPYSDRKPRTYGDKPSGDRKPREFGDRKPRTYGDKPSGDRKPHTFGDKSYKSKGGNSGGFKRKPRKD